MSVYRRMLGRELPCSITDLLEIPASELTASTMRELTLRAESHLATPDEFSRLAGAYLAQQEPGLAIRLLKIAIRRGGDTQLRVMLAASYEKLGQHDRAASQLDAAAAEFTATNPGISHVSLLCASGLSHEKSGSWQAAIHRYHDALKGSPSELFARYRLVAISLAHGRLAQAALHLRSILRHHPAEKSARVCLAHLLQMAGRHHEATWQYEQALCLEPDSWELPVDVSTDLHQAEGSDKVINVLEQLVNAQPHFPDLKLRLGNLYSMQGDDQAASIAYEQALQLHPEYFDCHLAIARHELRMGRLDQAVAHFRQAIQINDQNVEVYVGLALSLRESGRLTHSLEMLDSAKRIAANSALLMAQLALIERQAIAGEGETESFASQMHPEWLGELIAHDKAMLEANPAWNDVRVRMGMFLRLLGESEQAWSVFRLATRIDPNCPEAWIQLGFSLADCGKPEQGEEALACALRLDHQHTQLLYKLALIHCGQLELDLTMEKIEQSAPNPLDANRRLWTAIDSLQMTGPQRRREARVATSR